MTTFWLISALLVAAALAFVVVPMLARREGAGFSRSAANVSVHRDQLRELQADRDSGILDAEQYESAKRELEARLLDDVRDSDAAPRVARQPLAAALAVTVAIPVVALTLYFWVGNPQAITAAHDTNAQRIEVLAERLAARLARNPDDVEGWAMLGRTYQALGHIEEAAKAYASAVARAPHDADLLADYALVLASTRERRFAGEPQQLLARALEADPNNVKALALAGSASFQVEDYTGAIGYWERMLAFVAQDADTMRMVQERIAKARARRSSPAARLVAPKSLGDLKLLHASEGQQALEEINRLHGKNVGAKAGYVAHYEKEGAAAMLYLAQASSPAEAERQLNEMSVRIRKGDTPFSELASSKRGKTTVYSALGQGQRHYFYRREASVLWLAVDEPIARQALAALFAK